jgi:hypothetical protein
MGAGEAHRLISAQALGDDTKDALINILLNHCSLYEDLRVRAQALEEPWECYFKPTIITTNNLIPVPHSRLQQGAHPSLLPRGHPRPTFDQQGHRFTQRRICHRG